MNVTIRYVVLMIVGFLLVKSLFQSKNKKSQSDFKKLVNNPFSPLSPNYLKAELNKQKLNKNYKINLLSNRLAEMKAKEVYKNKGFIYDNENKALSALNVESKAQISQIATAFESIYGLDMAEYLNYLEPRHMDILNERINKLK